MRKTIKCAVSLLLCLVMTVGLLPVAALADDGDVEINDTNFPDSKFRLYVSGIIDDGDGVLTRAECASVGFIDVSGRNISTLKGIEYFTELWSLYCSNNNLSSLDLSKNTELRELRCDNNKLTSLNISQSENLTDLICYNNKLTSLNISNNTGLNSLSCNHNPIDKLDIRNNQNLVKAVTLGTKGRTNWNENIVYYSLHTQYNYSYLSINTTSRIQTGSTEPPAVTKQPKDKADLAGKSVTISVTAQGSELQYQWYAYGKTTNYKWTAVNGGIGPKLTVKINKKYSTSYYCEITNSGGSVCTVIVCASRAHQPRIFSQPRNKTVKAGQTATFMVRADGGGLKYQWYYQKPNTKKWVKAKNGTGATLNVKVTKKMNGYQYRCKVYNAAGSVYSKTVKLKVKK